MPGSSIPPSVPSLSLGALSNSSEPKVLFVIDFDQTMVKDHIFKKLDGKGISGLQHGAGAYDSGKVARQTEAFLGEGVAAIKNPTELAIFIQEALAQGHSIAIGSYSDYPDAIDVALGRLVQAELLTPQESSQIHIQAFLPVFNRQSGEPAHRSFIAMRQVVDAGHNVGKQMHIAEAIKHFEEKEHRFCGVVLLDDSSNNIRVANLAKKGRWQPSLAVSAVSERAFVSQPCRGILVPVEANCKPTYFDAAKQAADALQQRQGAVVKSPADDFETPRGTFSVDAGGGFRTERILGDNSVGLPNPPCIDT